jgi:hypothetical protein
LSSGFFVGDSQNITTEFVIGTAVGKLRKDATVDSIKILSTINYLPPKLQISKKFSN